MNAIIEASDFRKACDVLKHTGSNIYMPILGQARLTARDNQFCIQSTNMSVYFKYTVPAEIDESWEATVDSKMLRDIANSTDEGSVVISSSGKKTTIECGESKFNLPGMDVNDFPDWPIVKGPEFAASGVGTALKIVGKMTPQKDPRRVLQGVYTIVENGTLQFAATDSRRLALKTLQSEGMDQKLEFILSKEAAASLLDREEVNFQLDDNGRVIRTWGDGWECVAPCIDGKYPKIDAVIPKNPNNYIEFRREAMIKELKRAAIFVKQTQYQAVVLSTVKNHLAITAESFDRGTFEGAVFYIEADGKYSLAFNVSWLLGMLDLCTEELVRMRFKGTNSPVLIDGLPEVLLLLMPVRKADIEKAQSIPADSEDSDESAVEEEVEANV